MTKIKKILIANRGEIACRVMKTCRKMGIGSVAVYSDADAKALHVRMADEAVHIGASPAAESYLVIDKIIAACKSSGADAVHPGYGFLSENPEFARRLKKEGITFIGPSPESMEAMGLKDAAKKLMESAGVPVTPGYHGKDQSPKLLKAKAGMIGYPVLIKAIAGGGGKGMRKVDAAGDFDDALASCMREAKSAFGDDRVLIEKYILSPRHIEVQVFGDTHGNVVHMYERDCSLQRRHQKVIEEAPAPGMTENVRAAMTKAAIEAAQAVNYVGAGTVEFIVDGSGKLRKDGFWFMEMNTRLQVEHPVTEMITGLDLVELQIRVAQGEKLPKQKDITMDGHAVEARLYAEDPSNDFLPSVGKITELYIGNNPQNSNMSRTDSGVVINSQISVYYDPMIAKLIGHSYDRNSACQIVSENLLHTNISGVKTNALFLYNILTNDVFLQANLSTGFIETYSQDILPKDRTWDPLILAFAACALLLDSEEHEQSTVRTPFDTLGSWALNNEASIKFYFDAPNDVICASITKIKNVGWRVCVLEQEHTIISDYAEHGIGFENEPNQITDWYWNIYQDYIKLWQDGESIVIPRYNPESTAIGTAGGNAIAAPMPGKIIAVNVAVGDSVKAGDKLIIMEAMKMEMSLEAPRDGIVAAVHCAEGALVSDGEVLLELEPEGA